MTDDTVQIHAARRDKDGDVWLQLEPEGPWYGQVDGGSKPFATVAELDARWGPSRPVRIVTTDPGDAERLRVAERERDSLARRLNERWGQLEEARAELAQVRDEAGLSADQHIRALAAQLYWNGSPGTWTLQDIVAWIRDGEVPSDAG